MTPTKKSNRTEMPTQTLSKGIALMTLAMLIIPGIDAIAKLVSGSISAGQAAWARFFFQAIFLAPFFWRHDRLKWDWIMWMHVARGFLLAISTLTIFAALKVMPLANVIAIFFVQPFIVTVLAAVILGETFGWQRMLAIAFGFIGALMIIKPSYEAFGLTALLPVCTAIFFALYIIITRWLVGSSSPLSMQFWAGVFGFITMSIALLLGYNYDIEILESVWPTMTQWQLLALLGIIATTGHALVVMAYTRASVSVLAPFQYLEIVGATALGFILFDELPDLLAWTGIGIIISSGMFVFYRERALSEQNNDACIMR